MHLHRPNNQWQQVSCQTFPVKVEFEHTMIFKGVINKGFFFFFKFGYVGAIQTYMQADSDEEYVQPRRRVPATNSHHQDDYNS